MATVNRFFRPTRIAQVNPISFEQLSYLPNLRRQQHNALLQGAVQNSLLSADTMGIDQEVARQVLDPLEQRAEEVSQNLSKNGYSNELGEEFIGIQKDIAKTQRDVTSKLTARKAGLQEKAKQITDFYKDQPQIANALTQQLYGLNTEASTLDENGNIQIPGMKTPFVAQVYTSEDKLDLYNKALEGLKPSLVSEYKIDTSGGWYDIVEQLETKGVSQERIASLMQTALGQDYLDSYKVEASVGGVGMSRIIDPVNNQKDYVKALQRDQNILLGAIDQQKNFILQNHLISKLTAYKKANKGALPNAETIEKFKEEIKSDKNYKEQTAEFDSRIAQVTNGDLTPDALAQGAIDIYAQQKLNNDILKTSEVYAYSQQTRDISKSNKPAHLFNTNLDQEDTGNDWLDIPGGGIIIDNVSPFSNTILDSDPDRREKLASEMSKKRVYESHGFEYNNGELKYKNGELVSPREFQDIKARYNNEIEVLKNNITSSKPNEEIQKYIKGDSYLTNLYNEQGAQAVVSKVNDNFDKFSKKFSTAKAIPTDLNDKLHEIYNYSLNNYEINTTDGESITFEQLVDRAGYSNEDKFYEKGFHLKSLVSGPGKGSLVEASYYNEDSKKYEKIFLQPPTQIQFGSTKSAEISQGIVEGRDVIPVSTAIAPGFKEVAILDHSDQSIKVVGYNPSEVGEINPKTYLNRNIQHPSVYVYPYDAVLTEEQNKAVDVLRESSLKGKNK